MTSETTQENSATTLVGVESDQDHHMVVDGELSGSAASAVSANLLPSPVDYKIKDSDSDRLVGDNTLQDMFDSVMARSEYNEKLPPCSESLRKCTDAKLFIRPLAFSSFQQVCPNLECQTKPVATTDSSQSGANLPTSCSGSQSASNPILRLMGKDLVVGREETMQLPSILSYDTQANFMSFGVPSTLGFINNHNPYSNHIQAFGGHQIQLQPLQRRAEKLGSPSPRSMDRMNAPQHHRPQEVILVDDDSHVFEQDPMANVSTVPQAVQNPNLTASQRLLSCLPLQNSYAPRPFAPSQRETAEGALMFPSPSPFALSMLGI